MLLIVEVERRGETKHRHIYLFFGGREDN